MNTCLTEWESMDPFQLAFDPVGTQAEYHISQSAGCIESGGTGADVHYECLGEWSMR